MNEWLNEGLGAAYYNIKTILFHTNQPNHTSSALINQMYASSNTSTPTPQRHHQAFKESALEEANRQVEEKASALARERQGREIANCERFRSDTMRRRATRLQDWVKSLASSEVN
jgi:hypothetical protein